MLTELFTSKTRVKLLLKLFLNPKVSCYVRELSKEFGTAPNAIKEELDSLSKAGYLDTDQQGRSTYFKANVEHPFFPEIHSIVKKTLGIDKIVDQVLSRLGRFEEVYILDDYAEGRDTGLVDVLVVGDVDTAKLDNLCRVVEQKINRKIRMLVIDLEEFETSRDIFMKRPHWKVV